MIQFHNDYESYFTDESLTKSDRRDKLVAAMEGVLAEAKKIKKYEDKEYQLQVTLSEDAVTQFLPECMVCFRAAPIRCSQDVISDMNLIGAREYRHRFAGVGDHAAGNMLELAATQGRLDGVFEAGWRQQGGGRVGHRI